MKITIALFAYGGIAAECLNSHIDLIAGVVKGGMPVKFFTIREDALISRSRCRATGKFLQDDTDVLVMLDHDIQYEPRDLFDLAEEASRHDAIVAVPYSKRGLNLGSACRPPFIPVGANELSEVDYVASGFMAIPRPALLRILDYCYHAIPPYQIFRCRDAISDFPSVWQPFVRGEEYLSEDYAFCARAELAGVKRFVFTRPRVKHWGAFGFTLPTVQVKEPTGYVLAEHHQTPDPVVAPA